MLTPQHTKVLSYNENPPKNPAKIFPSKPCRPNTPIPFQPCVKCAPGVEAEVLGVCTAEEGPPGSGLTLDEEISKEFLFRQKILGYTPGRLT